MRTQFSKWGVSVNKSRAQISPQLLNTESQIKASRKDPEHVFPHSPASHFCTSTSDQLFTLISLLTRQGGDVTASVSLHMLHVRGSLTATPARKEIRTDKKNPPGSHPNPVSDPTDLHSSGFPVLTTIRPPVRKQNKTKLCGFECQLYSHVHCRSSTARSI